MAQTRFSERLKTLMTTRKITGQTIADIMGVSQRTISRYANGEVDPKDEVKNKIYKIIAEISGIEEDGLTEDELEYQEAIQLWNDNDWTDTEIELGNELLDNYLSDRDKLKSNFLRLTSASRKYYLENFEILHSVEEWECDALEMFHGLKPAKQTQLLAYLDSFNISLNILKNPNKIWEYMKMINVSQNRPIIVTNEKTKESDELFSEFLVAEDSIEVDTFINTSMSFLHFTPYDWYFLMRLQIFSVYDMSDTILYSDVKEAYMKKGLYTLLNSYN